MKLKYPLILASGSPRRKELLRNAGFNFKSVVKAVDEIIDHNLSPEDAAMEVAHNKLKSYKYLMQSHTVLCADTIVVLGKKILGKPVNRNSAIEMLESLSGKRHKVITGVSIGSPDKTISFYSTTYLAFYNLEQNEINNYIGKSKPFDKAGGYGIQEWIGLAGIKQIEGDYYNVVGLPISKVYQTLKSSFT